MYEWASDLFPLNRSITGDGVRKTLEYLKLLTPELVIKEIASNTKVFDWEVPKEWKVNNALLIGPRGNIIIDWKVNNLHLVNYSCKVNCKITLSELKNHLFYLEEMPDAIPYITSYYSRNWGFCLTYNQFLQLEDGIYTVLIDTELFDGVLNYGEILIPGKVKDEVFFSTYICHPSMANNEISGPVVTCAIAREILNLSKKSKLYYSYRIIFIPETIGAITYLAESDRYKYLKENVIAGFQVTCVGDDNMYSFLPSKYGNTYSDKVALFVLNDVLNLKYKEYSFNIDRGSDERQWSSPGIDLPFVSIMRTKYGEYSEYHTSLDNLDYISPMGLMGAFKVLLKCVEVIELNCFYKSNVLCEPQLGKINLYPAIGKRDVKQQVRDVLNALIYMDGLNDLIDICRIGEINYEVCIDIISELTNKNLINESKRYNSEN